MNSFLTPSQDLAVWRATEAQDGKKMVVCFRARSLNSWAHQSKSLSGRHVSTSFLGLF